MHPTRAGGLIAEEPKEYLAKRRRGMYAFSVLLVFLGVVIPFLFSGQIESLIGGICFIGLGAYVLVWSSRMTPVRVYQNGIEHYGTLGLELLKWDQLASYRDAKGLVITYYPPVTTSRGGSARSYRTIFLPDSTPNYLAVSGFVKQMIDEQGQGGGVKAYVGVGPLRYRVK